MTKKEIEKELGKIYKEMKRWREVNKELNYAISKNEVERRELFLISREELYKLKEAKKTKNKLAADVHEATYNVIKATLELY